MNTYHLDIFINGRTISRETTAHDLKGAVEIIRRIYDAPLAILTRVVSINGETV